MYSAAVHLSMCTPKNANTSLGGLRQLRWELIDVKAVARFQPVRDAFSTVADGKTSGRSERAALCSLRRVGFERPYRTYRWSSLATFTTREGRGEGGGQAPFTRDGQNGRQ